MRSSSQQSSNFSRSRVDFYRRVPKDLTEATSLGALMSLLAMATMTLLFFAETFAFARTNVTTEIALDGNSEQQIQLNFNISLYAIQCDYVSLDVWDVLGTNRQNVTKNVEKWQIDEQGDRRVFNGLNREVREVIHEEHDETLEELHEDGVHAVALDSSSFDSFVQGNDIVFIDFYASWCIWCQRLHPTWEKFAEEIDDENMPISVGAVDCVTQDTVCRKERVMAFPMLTWYEDGKQVPPEYKGDRTVEALMSYAKRKLKTNDKHKNWDNKPYRGSRTHITAHETGPLNPGCQVSGSLMVNRVPGNFHIEAKSINHNLNAAMTNLTHRVNHLSFGEMGKYPTAKVTRALKKVPKSLQEFTPLDNKMYKTREFHQAHHHYIKVVSTHLNVAKDIPVLYQFLQQSQVVHYEAVNVPEARFSYDLSPMSVLVERKGRKWYDYLTSLCAIIGGTFTTLGLIDATLYKVFKPKKL